MDPVVYFIIAVFAVFMVVLGYCASLDYLAARKSKGGAAASAGQRSAN
jgi:hypothetical protein